jgi:hypothetical protein
MHAMPFAMLEYDCYQFLTGRSHDGARMARHTTHSCYSTRSVSNGSSQQREKTRSQECGRHAARNSVLASRARFLKSLYARDDGGVHSHRSTTVCGLVDRIVGHDFDTWKEAGGGGMSNVGVRAEKLVARRTRRTSARQTSNLDFATTPEVYVGASGAMHGLSRDYGYGFGSDAEMPYSGITGIYSFGTVCGDFTRLHRADSEPSQRKIVDWRN